jgi:hypothetical protein
MLCVNINAVDAFLRDAATFAKGTAKANTDFETLVQVGLFSGIGADFGRDRTCSN